MEFKLKNNVESTNSDDFWYDLAYGGYIKPEKILADEIQIQAVMDAVDLLREFEDFLDDNGLLELI